MCSPEAGLQADIPRSEMHREDLMNPDLLSEIVLLGTGALIVVALFLLVVAAFTQPTALAWQGCGELLRAM